MELRYLFFPAVLAVAALASCGSRNASSSDSDSLKSVDGEDEELFSAPDLAWKELKGNVESCVLEYYTMDSPRDVNVDSMAFAPDGSIATLASWSVWSGKKVKSLDVDFLADADGNTLPAADKASEEGIMVSIERDAQRRIVSFSHNRPDGEYSESGYTEYYTWGESGYPASLELVGAEWTTRVVYEYDDAGRLVRSVAASAEYDYESTDTQTYVCKAEDSHGNWTEREVSVLSEEDDEGRKATRRCMRIDRRRIRYRR